MTFAAFQAQYHRYLSEDALHELLREAKTSAYYQDVLASHLKNGLFTYKIIPTSNKYLGVVEFNHADILRRLSYNEWDHDSLQEIIDHNMAALSNTVLHKPYEEFADLLGFGDAPFTVQQLRPHTGALAKWMAHLRMVYNTPNFHSYARKTTVAIALDLVRLIQAKQENRSLQSNTDPFARAGVTDRAAIIETLHHTLISLGREEVIRYRLPENPDWNRLLERPDLSAACAPGTHVKPLPNLPVFEDIAMQTGQKLPARMLISPDADTLIANIAEESSDYDWGVFHTGSQRMQAFLIASPVYDQQFAVYMTSLDSDLTAYVGELEGKDRSCWEERFTAMVDEGARAISNTEFSMLSRT